MNTNSNSSTDPGNTNMRSSTSTGTGNNMAKAKVGGSVSIDERFLMDAAKGNNAEIQMAQLAVQNASSPEVRSFAQLMIDHHTAANAQLAELARSMNVTLPTTVAPNHRVILQGLRDLSGTEFDMAYVKQQLGDHALARDMYEMNRKNAKDKALKDYAKQTLPTVEAHLERLRTMDTTLAPTAIITTPAS
jgi:putative membrane protein